MVEHSAKKNRADSKKGIVNRTRNGTCVNRVVLELWTEQSMY
jgi:hypothetical protein